MESNTRSLCRWLWNWGWSYFFTPNHIAITLVPIFTGDYKTQLRLKCGNNYSNAFVGAIKHSQFEYEK